MYLYIDTLTDIVMGDLAALFYDKEVGPLFTTLLNVEIICSLISSLFSNSRTLLK